MRRVLHNIREEYKSATKDSAASTRNVYTISKFVLQGQPRKHTAYAAKSEGNATLKEDDPDDPDSFARGLKPVLMEAIQDVLDELETVYDSVSKNAKDHIHSEYVLRLPPCTPIGPLPPSLLLARSSSRSDTPRPSKRSSSPRGTTATTP